VSDDRNRVTVLANFAEVWLAKEGHRGVDGINLLTKVQLPNLASLYGAMLAGVDAVIMGAGIPREIPGVLDALVEHGAVKLKLDIEGLGRDEAEFIEFDPARCIPESARTRPLSRPDFIAVISASSLATTLARKSSGRVDGFVIEGPTAGGHNAPPRGELRLSESGEPLYGERHGVDLAKIRELGLPFWLAGGAGSPAGLSAALAQGAAGIQVGTLFAYCDESGLAPDLKKRVLAAARTGNIQVRTDPRASPTGFPFKVVTIGGDEDLGEKRERNCDLGYLRVPVRMPDGRTVYRCSAEPVVFYVRKGGTAADAEGRRCLCNGLTAAIGQAQWRQESGREIPLVTSGDDLISLAALGSIAGYRAQDVLEYLGSS
jgi:NAD(P)H-dependent flavin oxidoreductase YrpB (nitropropane dioxygenase family)